MGRIGAVLALMLAWAGAARAEAVKAEVETGVLVGEVTDRAEIFRNIPYAAPPVGDLRWRPPAPALPWTGERAAVEKGPSCPQPMKPDGAPNSGAANGSISEDCLQLNVFAPRREARKGPAPVMVWIHGGANAYGAAWVYDGQAFARDGVVVVTVNYRVGPLGFFAHPALTREAAPDAPLGSYGVMDQIAALEWVKRNITAFGGDPANVTVFGESAGGSNTLALLTTPRARGLFHKAIVQSGGGWAKAPDLAEAEAQGAERASAVGLPGAEASAAELRAVPVEALVEKAWKGMYSPIVDGRLTSRTISRAFADGAAADVPLIIGANSGEDSLIGLFGQGPVAIAVRAPPRLRSAYPADPALAGRDIFGDWIMVAPARWIAARASGGQPAWLYHFSYVGARFRPQGVTRAAHAAEIQYVFEYWGRRTPMSAVSEDDRAMAALMHGCWVAFARTGRPDCPSGEAWPAYDPKTDKLLEFGQTSGVRQGFRKRELDATQAVELRRLGLPN
jgi:para-nitrobenzyl esterase